VDLVLYNQNVGNYILMKNDYPNIVQLEVPLANQSAYIAFSKNNNFKLILPVIDSILKDLWESGKYQHILEKYGMVRE